MSKEFHLDFLQFGTISYFSVKGRLTIKVLPGKKTPDLVTTVLEVECVFKIKLSPWT